MSSTAHNMTQSHDTARSQNTNPASQSLAAASMLVAVPMLALGLQALRALLPMLVFGIRDRFAWSALGAAGSIRLALVVFGIFAAVWLGGPLGRWLGERRTLSGSVMVCGLAVVAAQLWPGDPLGQVVAMALAMVAMLIALPRFWRLRAPQEGPQTFAGLLLAGLLLDGAIHLAWGTVDPIWRHDLLSLGLTLTLVALQLLGLARLAELREAAPTPPSAKVGLSWRWLALGPWLFLEVVVFHNLARVTTLAEWAPTLVGSVWLGGRWLAWVVVGRVAAPGHRSPVKLLLAVALLASTGIAWPQGSLAVLLVLVGQVANGLLLSCLVDRAARGKPGLGWNGGASVLLFITLFLYYGAYDLPVPFRSTDVLPVAALGLLVATLVGRPQPWAPTPTPTPWRPALWPVPGLALAVVLGSWPVTSPSDARANRDGAAAQDSTALRLMTFNLHCGFGPRGVLALEAQARVIEAHDPDVVALQEVSRGWAINGSVDSLTWLARRLDMEVVFAPTADPLWGNALLTRRPVTNPQRVPLPQEGTRMARGLLAVEVPSFQVAGKPLWVMATHYHHRRRDGALRLAQVETTLDLWSQAGHPPLVLLGDLNALPDTPEMQRLAEAGLRDVVPLAGLAPAPTFRSDRLLGQIDYLWISPELNVRDVAVPHTLASDHLPVLATLTIDP